MTYLLLSVPFLVTAIVIAVLAVVRLARRDRTGLRLHLAAVGAGAAVLVVLTAVFDNVMIAVGLFHYAPDGHLGVRVLAAPIEDFAYPIAATLLLPALWVLLPARSVR